MQNRPAQKSDFWGKSFIDELFSYNHGVTASKSDRVDIQKMFLLNDIRSSISDFVQILTGEPIPVEFKNSTNGQSYYARGRGIKNSKIVISADVTSQTFDSVVGLALHEATHVIRTNMKYFNTTYSLLSASIRNPFRAAVIGTPLYMGLKQMGYGDGQIMQLLWRDLGHFVLNFIEDRVIDAWQYKNSPGYREYYLALYDTYFSMYNDDDLVETDAYTNPDLVDSYLWRIFTLINENPNLDALPKLREISELLNLPKIHRLTTTKKSFDLMLQVVNLIAANTKKMVADQSDSMSRPSKNENASGSGMSMQSVSSESDSSENNQSTEENDASSDKNEGNADEKSDTNESDSSGDSEDNDVQPNLKESTPNQKNSAKKSLEKKKKFLSGEHNKALINKQENEFLDSIKDGTISLIDNGYNGPQPKYNSYYYARKGSAPDRTDKTLVVRKVTEAIMKNPVHRRLFNSMGHLADYTFEKTWSAGIAQGNSLAKKVQIRTEEKVTTYNRLDYGKIEQRRIHALATGAEDVFYRTVTDSYNDVLVWVSVDASGSMGCRWEQTVLLMVTLAQAAKKIRGFDIIMDIRGDTESRVESYPSVAVIFDSRTDGMATFKSILSRVHPGGTTPEGLCIRGIVDLIPSPKTGQDTYFINISDGMPGYYNFQGKDAVKYTKSVISSLKKRGIGVLGYFVGNQLDGQPNDDFKTMYGEKESHYIHSNNVTQIARTINALLMTKNQ